MIFSTILEGYYGDCEKNDYLYRAADQWIKAKIARGQFTNDSEYIRDLVWRDQEKTAEIEALRAALIEGEQSGMSTRTPDDIRKAVQKRMRKNGRV